MAEKISDLRRTWEFFWRSWTIQATWNYERQMNMGFMYGIAPTLERLYPDKNDPEQVARKKEAYERNMAFYNCTPQTSSFVLGLVSSMEEKYARDRKNFNPDTINTVKTSLMGPLSGIGDSFFQGTVRIIAFGLGISLAQQGSVLGPILAVLLSFLPAWLVTWYGGKLGYQMGEKYLSKLQEGNLMEQVLHVCSIVGVMVIGAMVASMIGIVTPIKFEATNLVLQDVLNSILPQMIPLALTACMYWMIKHKFSTGKMLAICIVCGIVFNALGIFA